MERAWWIYLRGDQDLKTSYSKTDDHLENIHVHLISTSPFYVLMTPPRHEISWTMFVEVLLVFFAVLCSFRS